jgi:hypothetical protein
MKISIAKGYKYAIFEIESDKAKKIILPFYIASLDE